MCCLVVLTGTWPGVLVKLVVLTLMTWNGAVMLLFIDMYVLICYVIYKEFEYLGRTFDMKIASNGAFNDDLGRVRFNYLQRYISHFASV